MVYRRNIIDAFCRGEEKGKASSLSIQKTGKGTALYSYTTPIAYKDDKGNIFMTKKKFSQSTSTQHSALKRNCFVKELDNDEYKNKLTKDGVSCGWSRL
jgi:hypothetical protein